MEVVKLVGIGIVISLIVVLLKQTKPEFALLALLAGSVLMLVYVLNYFSSIFAVFKEIINKTGINSELFAIVLKIIGVGYLVEFGASVCNDSGNTAIGDKIVLGGKIIIFAMALPIITNLFDLLLELLK